MARSEVVDPTGNLREGLHFADVVGPRNPRHEPLDSDSCAGRGPETALLREPEDQAIVLLPHAVPRHLRRDLLVFPFPPRPGEDLPVARKKEVEIVPPVALEVVELAGNVRDPDGPVDLLR